MHPEHFRDNPPADNDGGFWRAGWVAQVVRCWPPLCSTSRIRQGRHSLLCCLRRVGRPDPFTHTSLKKKLYRGYLKSEEPLSEVSKEIPQPWEMDGMDGWSFERLLEQQPPESLPGGEHGRQLLANTFSFQRPRCTLCLAHSRAGTPHTTTGCLQFPLPRNPLFSQQNQQHEREAASYDLR